MSTTANSSSLFDSYRKRLSDATMTGTKAHQSGSHVSYRQGEKYDDVLAEIQKAGRDKRLELESAEGMRGRNQAMSSARSAFAAGAASRSKKLFRPKGPTAFSAIGKTDSATENSLLKRRKEIADLDAVDPTSAFSLAQQRRNQVTYGGSLGFFAF